MPDKSIVYPLRAGRQALHGSVHPQKSFYREQRALSVPACFRGMVRYCTGRISNVPACRTANGTGNPEMKLQQKFDQIVSRQSKFRWGDTYIPSTRALPGEAPRGSRASRLNSRKLGRAIHALSIPERVFTQLALYHPALIDIHEQKMLSPVPTVHPLRGHPLMKESFPPPLRGTLDVAEDIGFEHHTIIYTEPDGERTRKPFPYQGDLLLFLVDSRNLPYAVNWTVKDTEEAFSERRNKRAKTPVQQKKDRDYAYMRAKLESEYYADAGIRTHQVSMDMLDSFLIGNLHLLFIMHDLPLTHDPQLLDEFSCEIQRAFMEGAPVAQIAIRYGLRWGARDQFIAKIYQDIWNRKLAVDLFKPIHIDHSLRHEEQDLLAVYGSLFEGFGK